MTSKPRVLVVDDSEEVRTLLEGVLTEAGFDVVSCADGASALGLVSSWSPSLVVLDVVLPDTSGVELCRTIRSQSNAFVLLLTSRDTETDILIGLGAGADDYLTKPFSSRELVMRVFTILRRARVADAATSSAESAESADNKRTYGNLTVDLDSRECTVAGTAVQLTKIEFDILAVLLSRPKVVFSRLQIIHSIWGDNWYGDEHVVDVHLSNIRKKFVTVEDVPYFNAVRGVGYRMAPIISATVH